MATFSGTVTVKGEPVEGRIVRLHHRITGALIDEDTSDGGGNYSLDSGVVSEANAVVVGLPIEEANTVESFNCIAVDGF